MATRSKLTSLEKVYLAGLFDGEGSISINKFRSSHPNYRCPHYVLSLTLTNTNESIIKWVHQKCGASKQMRKREWGKKHWKTSYSWMASANKAILILREIYPHLKVKKEQAKTAILFQEKKMRDRKFVSLSARGHTLSPETLAEREEMYQKMKLLNKNSGVIVAATTK